MKATGIETIKVPVYRYFPFSLSILNVFSLGFFTGNHTLSTFTDVSYFVCDELLKLFKVQ